jgi:hypothetical protein
VTISTPQYFKTVALRIDSDQDHFDGQVIG